MKATSWALFRDCFHSARQDGPVLLARFKLGSNQTDFIDSRAAHDVNGAGDFLEQDFVIAFDESDFLRAFFKDFFDART